MTVREPCGRILGLVPYDLRAPTLARARRTFWNARENRFTVSPCFGVGSTALRSVLWRVSKKGRGR